MSKMLLDEIYIQYDDDGEGDRYHTWCEDKIEETDVKYKRAISTYAKLDDVLAEIESINLIEERYTVELDKERLQEVLSKYFI
ncbi:MAG: hypothetical protein GY853_01465 [PVC group bacterium]|nr:hypothetical protein [PVC group bacterium]